MAEAEPLEGPQEVLNLIVAAKNSLVDSEEAEPEMLPEEIPVVVHAAVNLKTLKLFGFVCIFTSF